MSEGEKGKAKERLDGEWKGEPKQATGDRRQATGNAQTGRRPFLIIARRLSPVACRLFGFTAWS